MYICFKGSLRLRFFLLNYLESLTSTKTDFRGWSRSSGLWILLNRFCRKYNFYRKEANWQITDVILADSSDQELCYILSFLVTPAL